MTEHATLPDPAPAADEHEDPTGPAGHDDQDHDLPAEAFEGCPVFDVDTPGGCG